MEYDNSYEVLKAAFDAQNGTFNVNPDNEYEVLRAVLDTENECLRVNIDGYITGETGLWEKCIKPATPGVYATYSGTPAGCSTSILVTADVIGIEGNGNFIKGDGVSDIDTNIATWNSSNPTNTISLTSGDGSQIQDNKTTVELSGGVEAIPSPGTFANFSGRPVGCGTPILLTADNKGVNGNSIDLYGNGTTNINDLLSSWNTSNPTNTATLTSGDGTQIPDNKSHTTLSGGRDETTNITTGVQLIEGGSTACGDNAIAGGLIEHSLNVYKFSSQIYDLWSDGGARMEGYTKNELLFCALTHDLGKLGYPDNPYYTESTDEWRRNKLGERYSHNPYISFMKHSDRSLFVLQQYQVKLTEAEFIGIMIHDGLYDDKNKPYYAPFTTSKILHTNLSYILHQADVMSYRIELEREITEDNLFDNPNQVKLSKPESTLDDLLNKLK